MRTLDLEHTHDMLLELLTAMIALCLRITLALALLTNKIIGGKPIFKVVEQLSTRSLYGMFMIIVID